MIKRIALAVALVVSVAISASLPRSADAGVSDTVLALAGPLAEQFGVSSSLVTPLLENGVSLESVTQLLLVSQASDSSFGDVSKLFGDSGNDVAATADKLGVASSVYSDDKVSAAIDQAKEKAAADATDKATDEASKAIGGALGGLGK